MRGFDCRTHFGPGHPGNGIAQSIEEWDKHLSRYLSEKDFDTYSQSPWVAGSQMLSLLAEITRFGASVCNKPGYVVVVLHLYKLLQKMKVMDEETILLDHLARSQYKTSSTDNFRRKLSTHTWFWLRADDYISRKSSTDRNSLADTVNGRLAFRKGNRGALISAKSRHW